MSDDPGKSQQDEEEVEDLKAPVEDLDDVAGGCNMGPTNIGPIHTSCTSCNCGKTVIIVTQ